MSRRSRCNPRRYLASLDQRKYVLPIRSCLTGFFLSLIHIYKVMAEPVLLCNSEIWIPVSRILVSAMRFLRSVTGYTRRDRLYNEDINKELNIFYPTSYCKEQRETDIHLNRCQMAGCVRKFGNISLLYNEV